MLINKRFSGKVGRDELHDYFFTFPLGNSLKGSSEGLSWMEDKHRAISGGKACLCLASLYSAET